MNECDDKTLLIYLVRLKMHCSGNDAYNRLTAYNLLVKTRVFIERNEITKQQRNKNQEVEDRTT